MSKTKQFIGSLAGIVFTASNVLGAADNGTGSTAVTSQLGPLSGLASQLLLYSKWIGIFVFILTIIILWITGNIARISNKVNDVLKSRDNLKGTVVEGIFVIIALMVLFGFIIPELNKVI